MTTISSLDFLNVSFTNCRMSIVERWRGDSYVVDKHYVSDLAIDWNHVSEVMKTLTDKNDYKTIGLLNFKESEVDSWQEMLPSPEHIILHLDHVPKSLVWETLYPEWIDEEEDFEIPGCPSLPSIQAPRNARMDLIAVKLPCKKLGKWWRDVARLHLQLAAARLAASAKGSYDVHVLFITECFPVPNLFTCKELLLRAGNAWLYKPNLNTLREKVQLPVGSCELVLPLNPKGNFFCSFYVLFCWCRSIFGVFKDDKNSNSILLKLS